MLRSAKLASMLVFGVTLSGCASIYQLDISDAREDEPVDVAVYVAQPWGLVDIDEVLLGVGPYGVPEGPYTDAGTATADTFAGFAGSYEGTLPGMIWGGHRLQATVNYHAVMTSGLKTTQKSTDFWVGAPQGCFDFDDGTLQEWRPSLLIAGGEEMTLETCATDGPPILWDNSENWPLSGFAPEHGALFLVLGPNCIPTESAVIGGADHWALNLLSPDIAADSEWQGVTGVSFRAKTYDVGDIRPPLWAQALLKVRRADGTETLLMGGPTGAFESIPDGGAWLEAELAIPGVGAEDTVVEVWVQIWGDPGTWHPDQRFILDGICPVKN